MKIKILFNQVFIKDKFSMKRVKYVIANWKMNGNSASLSLIKRIDNHLRKKTTKTPRVIICPPFTLLSTFTSLKSIKLIFGAQNIHRFDKGAYTGEISAKMLNEVGVNFCIVGHSERRQVFKENNEDIKIKATQLLDEKIIPIISERPATA